MRFTKQFFCSLFLVFFCSNFLIAQTTAFKTPISSFMVGNKDNAPLSSKIESQLAQSDIDQYRLKDVDVSLTFDNGFTVLLLAANTCKERGLAIDPINYPTASTTKRKMPLFHLLPTGQITAAFLSLPSKH
jgi:hypothetical protein